MKLFKQARHLLAMALVLLFLASPALAGAPKYVLYFIGDGLVHLNDNSVNSSFEKKIRTSLKDCS